MADKDDRQMLHEAPSHCPKCDEMPRLMVKLADTENGRMVRLYRCPLCAALIWMD
jgi:hypothetical protein